MDDYPALLPVGFHLKTLEEIRDLCVSPFPTSSTRQEIMEGLEKIIWKMVDIHLNCEVWVNGSFLTQKIDPKDSDIAIKIESAIMNMVTPTQLNLIRDLRKQQFVNDYKCESFVFFEYPQSDPLHGEAEFIKAYWMRQFGFSRQDSHKGIVLVKVS